MTISIEEKFLRFFEVFISFLENDATSSLIIGRNRGILLNFYCAYVAMNDNNDLLFNTNIKYIEKKIALFINSNKNHYIRINLDYKLPSKNSTDIRYSRNQDITNALKKFVSANIEYTKYRKSLTKNELQEIYLKNSSDNFIKNFDNSHKEQFIEIVKSEILNFEMINNQILKQALMEFFNAISHLTKAVCGYKKAENIKSFQIHLYRGTLDYYKAIIKDYSYLKGLNDYQKNEFAEIRKEEYVSIGNETNRSEIHKKFKVFVNKLINT